MLYPKRQPILVFLFLLLTSLSSRAQLSSKQQKILDKINAGHTHVLVKDTAFPRSAEFLAIFKKYWTLGKGVSYMKRSSLGDNLIPGDTYLMLQPYKIFINRSNRPGADQVLGLLYFSLWTPTEKTLKKGNKFKFSDGEDLSAQQLWPSKNASENIRFDDGMGSSMEYYDLDGGGQIYNWSPAMLKNRLQLMVKELTTGKAADFTDDFTNKEQVKLLKDKFLYLPEDNFNNYGIFAGRGKMQDTAGFFKDYKFKYQVLNSEQIDKKILDDSTPSFYLTSILSGGCKLLSVINSQSGEVIYYRFTGATWNFKTSDLKELSKQIDK